MRGQVAPVTGARRGVGSGVAAASCGAGATACATGRNVRSADLPAGVIRLPCHHANVDGRRPRPLGLEGA